MGCAGWLLRSTGCSGSDFSTNFLHPSVLYGHTAHRQAQRGTRPTDARRRLYGARILSRLSGSPIPGADAGLPVRYPCFAGPADSGHDPDPPACQLRGGRLSQRQRCFLPGHPYRCTAIARGARGTCGEGGNGFRISPYPVPCACRNRDSEAPSGLRPRAFRFCAAGFGPPLP